MNKVREEHVARAHKEKLIISGSLAVLLLCMTVALLWWHEREAPEVAATMVATTTEQYTELSEANIINPFDDVRIGARGAVVYDIQNDKVLYEKNSTRSLPIASITKIMTAVTATETLDADTTIQISWQDLATEGNHGLLVGEYFSLHDLIDFMLVSSSNDAAEAIARVGGSTASFVASMNTTAEKIGMNDSQFSNPSGLDMYGETQAGAQSSAADIAKLLSYTLKNHPSLLEATHKRRLSLSSQSGYTHTVLNTNEIVTRLPNAIGSKTGFTLVAGGNLAVVIDPGLNNPVAIVVLGSTKAGRFTDVELLAETTLEYLSLR